MMLTNIFFRKDERINIFDHQASSSSEVVARKCSVKKMFLKNFVKLSVENQCRFRTQVLSVNFAKFSRTPLLNTHGGRFFQF